MRGFTTPTVNTMRQSAAVVGASLSLLLIPVVAANAAQSPSLTPASTESTPASTESLNHSGRNLRLNARSLTIPSLSLPAVPVPSLTIPSLSIASLSIPSLRIPSTLDLGGLLHLGPGSATSTPPMSSALQSGGGNTSPPPTSHLNSTSPTHLAVDVAALPIGGGQPGGYSSSTQPTFRPTTSAQPTRDTGGTGSLELIRRLIGSGGVLMIAALLATTTLAVIALARLGGVRRGRRHPRQH